MLLRGLRLRLSPLSESRGRLLLLLSELVLLRPRRRRLLLAVVFLVRLETAARVVPVAVSERHVRPGVSLLRVHRSVQEVVHEMVLRGLLANVLAAGRHANQMHLDGKEQY